MRGILADRLRFRSFLSLERKLVGMARTEFDARSKLKRSREELEEQYEEDELEHDNDWGELDREEGGEGDFTIRDAVPDKQTIERTVRQHLNSR